MTTQSSATAPLPTARAALPWVTTAARLVLAGVLIVAGWSKMGAPALSIEAVKAYQLLPTAVAEIVGYVLPILEIVIGLLLVVGLLTRMAAIVTAVLMCAFIVGIASAWARGLNIDCGCFGGGGALPPGQKANYLPEILRDVGFLALAAWVAVRPPGRLRPRLRARPHTGGRGGPKPLPRRFRRRRRSRSARGTEPRKGRLMGNAARRATREKIRLQREQERKRERRRRQVTITLSVVGVVVLIVAMVAIWQSTRNRSEGYAGELAPISRTAEGDVVMAQPGVNAPVLDIYEDFQCPACKAFEETSGDTIKRSPPRAR